MSLEANSAEFIKKFEGYADKAYWDVNAWRIGYGSDTLTLPNGTYRKVVQNDRTNPELAKKDLTRRTGEYISRARATIGQSYWDKLPEPAKVALVSIAYNYGNITKQAIINAARNGNMDALSLAIIESTYNDNAGILRDRRAKEAALVKSAVVLAKRHPRVTVAIFSIVVIMIISAILLLIYRNKIAKAITSE